MSQYQQEAIDQLTKELEERDRTIAQMTDDYNSMRQGHYEEIEKLRTIIASLEKTNDILTTLRYRLEGNLSNLDNALTPWLKQINNHLISLEIDLHSLGSWSNSWRKEEWVNYLTHAEKSQLAQRKISQIKFLSKLTNKSLDHIRTVIGKKFEQSEF
jgi:hypothetical protein